MGTSFDRGRWGRTAVRGSIGLALAVAAIVLGAALLVTRLVSEEALRTAVLERASAALGQSVTAKAASLSIWPRPVAVLEDVATKGARVGRLEARLAIPALIAGRVEPVRFKLMDGTFDLGGAPTPNAAAAALERLAIRRVDAERVALTVFGERLDVAEMRLDQEGGAVSMRGRTRWRGETVSFDLRAVDLARLADGTSGSLAIDAAPLALRFDGGYGLGGPGSGTLSLEGPALAAALEWLGLPPDGASADAFAVSGRTGATAWGWELEDAAIALAEMRGEGVLGLVRGERRTVTGTLAFGTIGADVAMLRRAVVGAGAALDADLRFSASEVRLGPVRFDDVAAALRADDDAVVLELGDARHAGGRAVGSLTMGRDGGRAAKAELRVFDAEIGSLPIPMPVEGPRVTGRADLAVNLELGTGSTGSAQFELRDGTLEGLDLRAVARLGPNLGADAARQGGTPFDTLMGTASLSGGILELAGLKLSAPGLAARLEGRIDLDRGVPSLSGEVATVGLVTDASDGGGLALTPEATIFFIGGTMEKPLIVPVDPR